jgi:phospholipase/carboxylesterase
MADKQLSLHHLVHFPASLQNQGTISRYPTILALHGRGSNERDLIELAPHLPEGLLWISPRAPLVLGPDSYEWYRVKVITRPDPVQVMAALETIEHFIDEVLSTYPVDPQKLFLLGFSQGSLLPMDYTLSHPSRIAGVIAQSGYIPNGVDLEINEADVKNKPFILTHGAQDTMIPVDWARASRDRLQKLGVNLNYHEFQMGHSVSMESLSVIAKWLKKQLGQ